MQTLAHSLYDNAHRVQCFKADKLLNRVFAEYTLVLTGAIAAISILGLYILLRRNAMTPLRMALFGLFYLAFAVGIAALWRTATLI